MTHEKYDVISFEQIEGTKKPSVLLSLIFITYNSNLLLLVI